MDLKTLKSKLQKIKPEAFLSSIKKYFRRIRKKLKFAFDHAKRYPLRFVGGSAALVILIIFVWGFQKFVFDNMPTTSPSVVKVGPKTIKKEVVVQKKFNKPITLNHADFNEASVEVTKPEEKLMYSSKKYAAWDIKKEQRANFAAEEIVVLPDQGEQIKEVKEDRAVNNDGAEAEVKIDEKSLKTDLVIEEKESEEKDDASFEKTENKPQPKENLVSYRRLENAGFSYLDEPLFLKGSALVYGPNGLYVEGMYLYLYGIQTDGIKYEREKVSRYLKNFIAGKEVQCFVVAFSEDKVAEALCYVDDQSINQKLVDEKMADNIAL